MEKLKREFENSVNCHTGNSTRRPPNQNKQEAQAGTDSYSSKPNQTRLPTPKTKKANCPSVSCRIANIKAENEHKAVATRRDYSEKKALHDVKEATILAPLKAEMREFMKDRDAMKAKVAMAEKQLEKAIAEAKNEPPQRRGKGKSHRATARAKAQRAAAKAAKQVEAKAAERASSKHAGDRH